MVIRGAGLVALLALVLLALNPGVPAEQAAAQEVFELKGDFDVTLLEAGTVTVNEIALSIPADGGDVRGRGAASACGSLQSAARAGCRRRASSDNPIPSSSVVPGSGMLATLTVCLK